MSQCSGGKNKVTNPRRVGRGWQLGDVISNKKEQSPRKKNGVKPTSTASGAGNLVVQSRGGKKKAIF